MLLRRELHVPNRGMRQQLLPILPEQLLPHLRLEFDLHRLEILHPTLRCHEGVVGAEEETVLQARGSLAQQALRNVTG